MINQLSKRFGKLSGGLLGGGALLFISMTIVNGGNYLLNLILGRWLGPAAFSDLSLFVTLMLMVTFITATFQLTAAKFAANATADNDLPALAHLRRWMGRVAWISGLVSALVVAGGAPFWQQFFHTQSAVPFIILGIGLPVYYAQGVDRGILQGQTRFGRLALSYQAEMWVRLGVTLLLVTLGYGVNGAVLAITLSFFATWLVARGLGDWAALPGLPSDTIRRTVSRFAGPVIVIYLSQILINNSDVLLVKRFFEPETAGKYAALALIGRIVFFATWSVVTALFPIVAQKHQKGEAHRHLLYAGLGMVAVVSGGIILATRFLPDLIVNTLFGSAYIEIAPLLWLYAVATAVYALANVVINYRLSCDNTAGAWLALVAGAAQIILISLFHASLAQVVIVQILLMSSLLVILLIWDGWLALRKRQTLPVAAVASTGELKPQ